MRAKEDAGDAPLQGMGNYCLHKMRFEGVGGEILKCENVVLYTCKYSNIHISKVCFMEQKLHNAKLIKSLKFLVSYKKVTV